ncbi:hypothetical protein SPV1_06154 [Mariprofundus ferrooxydans PV-1]|uniref:Uncharacterized protein n=1 Tax=Mariprofundus ferrooxydans PV-1 TaxID=314345 RepID=Q0EWU0_9PROT|nr:hypothetical protein SPV1_06154 [Mariprofundus ferrooxydans PV-1]
MISGAAARVIQMLNIYARQILFG